MKSGVIRIIVVTERIGWIRQMIQGVRSLPLTDYNAFFSDYRNFAAAESYLRRALEALLDLGRHVLAKGFNIVVAEYKEIGLKLAEQGVLDDEGRQLMRQMAGYRNRMVHFYNELSKEELYDICNHRIDDIETVCETIAAWLRKHPEYMDEPIE